MKKIDFIIINFWRGFNAFSHRKEDSSRVGRIVNFFHINKFKINANEYFSSFRGVDGGGGGGLTH